MTAERPRQPFESSQMLLRNATKRADDAEGILKSIQAKPDQANLQIDTHEDPNIKIVRVQFHHQIPDALTFAVRDTFADLRASLDHACYDCAEAHKGRTLNRGTYFPFAKFKNDISGAKKVGSLNLPDAILDLAISFKPFSDEDGNKLLYAVNNIRNVETHRILQPMGRFVGQQTSKGRVATDTLLALMEQGVREVASFEVQHIFPPKWNPEKNQLDLAWYDSRVISDVEFEVGTFICLGDIDFLRYKPPMPILREAITIVETIIGSIKTTSEEIGLF